MAFGPIISWQIDGETMETVKDLFSWAPKSLQTAATKWKMLPPRKESYHKPRQYIKKQRHSFADKGKSSQSYGFSNGHVSMWELNHEEVWLSKNWCFQTVVTLESPLSSKKFKPVNPKGNQPWIFIGKTDVEAEVPILWPPDAKSWLIGKDPDAKKDRHSGKVFSSLEDFSTVCYVIIS